MHAKVLTSSGSSGFRVGETDRGAPLGEQRSRCRLTRGPALRVPVAVMGATEKSEVPRDRRPRPAHAGRCGRSRSDALSCSGARSVDRCSCSAAVALHTCRLTPAEIARPEAHDFAAGVAAPVGFAPVAARRAVSSWVLGGGGAEVGIGPNRPRRCGSGAGGDRRVVRRRSGPSLHSRLRLRRRSSRGVCLRVPRADCRRALGAVAGSGRGGRAPPAPGGRRAVPSSYADPRARAAPGAAPALLALRVDSRLQLVAALAERAHPVGRRRQLRVQVDQHPADPAGRSCRRPPPPASAAPPHPAPAPAPSGGGGSGSGSAGGNGTAGAESGAGVPAGAIAAVPEIDPRRRCRSKAHCSSAAALSVSEPSRNPSRASG